MAGEQTPAPAVFDEGVGKLKLEIERFPARDSFGVRLPRDNGGVAMDAHFHVVILEDFVFGIVFLCLTDIVGPGGDFAPLNWSACNLPLRLVRCRPRHS